MTTPSMTTPSMTTRPGTTVRTVITGWSAVSPFGVGRAAYAAGVRAGRPTATAVDPDHWRVPDREACLVPGYRPEALVARVPARSVDRVTVLAMAAVGHLIDEGTEADGRTGLVLGTTVGSLSSSMKITRDSLGNARPYFVDPKTLPMGLMNGAAARCAIHYGITGPNTTIAAGAGAVVTALGYAGRLLTADRAARVLVGAAEEYSEERSWLAYPGRAGGAPLGEGSVVFRVEPAGGDRAALAEILAVDSRVCPDADAAPVLRASLAVLLARASVPPGEVWAVVPATRTAAERAAGSAVFGADALDRCPGTGQLGDTGAAAVGFAIASALCAPGAAGRLVAVTSCDPDGGVGGVLLRLGGEAR